MGRRIKSKRALARELKVTLRAVQDAEGYGRIRAESDGTYDLAKVRRDWKANTRTEKRHRGKPDLGKSESNGTATGNWNAARTDRERIRIQRDEIKLRQETGELVERVAVERDAFDLARKLRDLLLDLPGEIGPRLAGATPQEAEELLEVEVRRICGEMSQGKHERNGSG